MWQEGAHDTRMDEAAPYGTFAPRGVVRRAVETTRALPDTWLARRLVILIRRFVAARLHGAPVDVEALGVRMRIHPYNNVCEKRMLYAPHTFDPEELALIRDRMRPGFVFVDIGANVGAYSLYVAAQGGPTARILLDLIETEDLPAIDALKLDVEGAEDIILEPFFREAPRALHPALVILENGEGRWQIDLQALMAQNGYRRIARTRLNLVFERRDDNPRGT